MRGQEEIVGLENPADPWSRSTSSVAFHIRVLCGQQRIGDGAAHGGELHLAEVPAEDLEDELGMHRLGRVNDEHHLGSGGYVSVWRRDSGNCRFSEVSDSQASRRYWFRCGPT